jgi:galactose mutarotase-like enzyme
MHTAERKSAGHVEAVVLAGPALEATFVPGAGMVGCSLRHRGDELLVQRGGLDAWRGTGKSFGLPLLHPWANRLPDWRYAAAGRVVGLDRYRGAVRPDENGLPIHGAMAAAEDWEVTACEADADSAHLAAELDYGRRDDRLAAFPFPHRLSLDVRLGGDTVAVTTTVTPTTDLPVPLAFGWHPWLGLPGVPRAEWELAMPERRHLLLDGRNLPTGEVVEEEAERAPLGDRTLDDHYEVGTAARFAIAGGGREITVSWDADYTHGQVFAPGTLDVVCLEPMMAPVAALASGDGLRFAAPGTSAGARFDITVT